MQKFNIYDNLEYSQEKVLISVMFDDEIRKEIRIVFSKNQIMKDHKTKFPIIVELVEGSIDFGVEEQVYTLKKGDIIALEGDIMHNLKANENSIVRLSLSKNDNTNRVKGVLKL
ncbi:cupin domain-containing protein [Halarcobacter bivalviorum]|uniref:cupin n=1 Tax=Halarcobacter bivalviorum TaxID=663364 RepID=UPI00100A5555|nr:cupin [Halarcobacter bivalviorum]RXK04460.1 cupin [Halarcobacter bivalviorum]